MKLRLVLGLYRLVLPIGLLFALPGSLLKMRRRGGYGRDFGQRLGIFRRETRALLATMEKPYWFHAVSVGEVLVARKLIAELIRQAPGASVILSTTTSTGHAVARKGAPPSLLVLFNPLDFLFCVRRALDAIRPGHLVLVEAEIWPNLVAESRRWGIPVALANARLSPRSERRYRRVRGMVAPVFSLLERVFVPEPGDVARWADLGVPASGIEVPGSVKHDHESESADVAASPLRTLLAGAWGDPLPPILMAASTHPGEESAIGRVFLELRRRLPTLRFLVAPRHFERADSVAEELRKIGLAVARRTRGPEPQADTFLIDTTGELRAWQGVADVVVVGKSFLTKGGQNPVEAIFRGRPVIVGPHMDNFADLVGALVKRGGVVQVNDFAALENAVFELLTEPARAAALVANARLILQRHQGAARRTIEQLLARPVE